MTVWHGIARVMCNTPCVMRYAPWALGFAPLAQRISGVLHIGSAAYCALHVLSRFKSVVKSQKCFSFFEKRVMRNI